MNDDPFSFEGDDSYSDAPPISTASNFHLTEKDKVKLEQEVKSGDANAAFRLYEYHQFSSESFSEADRFLEEAARLGHPIAQYNLAKRLTSTNRDQARIWAKKALNNGEKDAEDLLRTLNSE